MPRFRAPLWILLPVALAACASVPAVPQRVDLDADLLSVRMSDGTTCLGPAPGAEAAAGWSGRLQGCAWDYAYTVEIDPGTNPMRFIFEEVFGALGLEGVLSPLAEVTITGADGRPRVFRSPPEPEED